MSRPGTRTRRQRQNFPLPDAPGDLKAKSKHPPAPTVTVAIPPRKEQISPRNSNPPHLTTPPTPLTGVSEKTMSCTLSGGATKCLGDDLSAADPEKPHPNFASSPCCPPIPSNDYPKCQVSSLHPNTSKKNKANRNKHEKRT